MSLPTSTSAQLDGTFSQRLYLPLHSSYLLNPEQSQDVLLLLHVPVYVHRDGERSITFSFINPVFGQTNQITLGFWTPAIG
jgi:hypothetical protein